MQNSGRGGFKAWDPEADSAGGDGDGGQIATAATFYSEPTEMAAFGRISDILTFRGTLAGTLTAEVSNASDEQIEVGADKWVELTVAGIPSIAVDTTNRVVDTDPLTFQLLGSGSDITVVAATTKPLPACVAAGSGVGKTLTASANGVLTIDGVAPAHNDLILVKNQANPADNGVYKLTTSGTVSVKFVLTRSTSLDQDAEAIPGTSIAVSAGGAVNGSTSWILNGEDQDVAIAARVDYARYRLRFDCASGEGSIESMRNLRAV